jgi:hypothetical protein
MQKDRDFLALLQALLISFLATGVIREERLKQLLC